MVSETEIGLNVTESCKYRNECNTYSSEDRNCNNAHGGKCNLPCYIEDRRSYFSTAKDLQLRGA